MPAQAPTIATVLKSMGYATGQFGKNHLGDRNKFLPTVHDFDEFWGYLYHLDAMEDPFHRNYPPALLNTVGPRNLLHCGKVGKQKITDEGPLPPNPIPNIKYNMETIDEVIRDKALEFIDKARQQNKPFFVWLNPSRMHVVTTHPRNTKRCARRRTAGPSRKPGWRSSTTLWGQSWRI
jgi:arylsulfatase A-like enzyme